MPNVVSFHGTSSISILKSGFKLFLSVCGELDVLDILYTAGADLNTSDIHGAFPIHYAAQMCSSTCEMGVDGRVGLTSKHENSVLSFRIFC